MVAETTRTSARSLTGRYMPARISAHSRWRFQRDRRAALLRRIGGGPPNERQALAISMLIDCEWAAFVAEHDTNIAPSAKLRILALRLASDARKQVLLWHRELTAASKVTPPAPEPAPSLEQVLADIASRRSGKAA